MCNFLSLDDRSGTIMSQTDEEDRRRIYLNPGISKNEKNTFPNSAWAGSD
jgi:hypothetical protein